MTTHTRLSRSVWALGLLSLGGLVLTSIAAEPLASQKPAGGDLTQILGGPDRYLTSISTDKPIYRPGETVFMRGVLLHHATHQPISGAQPQATMEVRGPKGDVVAGGMTQAVESVLGFSWTIPAEQAGGTYTLTIRYPWQGHPPAERTFDIRAYRAPRLKSQITFVRDGYGPGDDVTAGLAVTRAEGGIPVGAKVTATARVDGVEIFRSPATIDALGTCHVTFPLPAEIERGEGTLALVIDDSGIVETASKTIPILLQSVDLAMYPEGGDLVAGVPNRVYFEAFTPAKKPADLAGDVLDSAGKAVAAFRSEHEGRGRFEFTPKAGEKYALRITEPAGIKSRHDLPTVEASGVVLRSRGEVTPGDEKVVVQLASPNADSLRVELRHRDELLDSKQVDVAAGEPVEISLDAKKAAGVLTVTAFDGDAKPLAERLVFREPSAKVQVSITPMSSRVCPGGKASVKIETRDMATGKPVPAMVGLTVTDDSVLELVEKREQAPRLPVMVLLESDVKELADAHVYLDSDNAKAPVAVDLLLGTQGWRRFATVDLETFVARHGDDARRVLALQVVTPWEEGNIRDLERQRGGFGWLKVPPPGAVLAAAPADERAADKPQPPAAPPVIAADRVEKLVKDQEEAHGGRGFTAAEETPLADALREAQGKLRQEAFLDVADEPGRPSVLRRNDFVTVRIYAHQVRPGREPGERRDFTETLFWSAGITTDSSGTATVDFGLSDAVTSFRVAADAFTATGALGMAAASIESVEPFYVEPKLPLALTVGDHVEVPLGIVNATPLAMDRVMLAIDTPKGVVMSGPVPPIAIAGESRLRRLLGLDAVAPGEGDLTIAATGSGYGDRVVRKLVVHPKGFPAERSFGGVLEPGAALSRNIVIPDDIVAGSLVSQVRVYPTPLASMTSAMERLIQEPCGCFEQTSSTTYPLVMAQRYFKTHQGVDPSLVTRSEEILARGYDRLMGFESKSGGFEWFGGDPGHDALTAYGLMQFTEMAQVRPVDAAMLARTRDWLLAQRDGSGGYARKTHTLHTWVTDSDCAAAYDTWALLVAGATGKLDEEIAFAIDRGTHSNNTYSAALAANVAVLAGEKKAAVKLLDRLSAAQEKTGALGGATTSIVGSGGEALVIETTALAALAWLSDPAYAEQVERAIEYLAEQCKGGRFGSTQSTVLAIKAIVAYDESRSAPKAPGTLELVVDGKRVGQLVSFTSDTQGGIDLPSIDALLGPGEHSVAVRMAGGSPMPCSVAVNFHRVKPESSDACKVRLETSLRDTTLDEGAVTEAEVVLENRSTEAVPNPIAIVGIPGGLEVRHDQLKELVKAGRIAAYEVLGRDLVLYWRAVEARSHVEIPVSLVAAVPGTFTGPASRAYLYYTDEDKVWTDGFTVTITPKATDDVTRR